MPLTNTITFSKPYLIPFLKYQIKHNTRLLKYYQAWLLENTSNFPEYYNYNNRKMEENQIKLILPYKDFANKCYLGLKEQRKFANLVARSFDVVVYNHLFFNYFDRSTSEAIREIIEKYKIDYIHFKMIKNKFERLRNNGHTARNKK